MLATYKDTDIQSISKLIRPGDILRAVMGTLGDRIRQAREELGWTQAQLAKKLKVSQSAISQAESSGKTHLTVKIALATGYSAYWLEDERGPKLMGTLEKTLRNADDALEREVLAYIQGRQAPRT